VKLFGFAIGVNVYAKSWEDARDLAEEYLTKLRNDNGVDRESEATVDMAELSGDVEEL
jgi:hypothetical protein